MRLTTLLGFTGLLTIAALWSGHGKIGIPEILVIAGLTFLFLAVFGGSSKPSGRQELEPREDAEEIIAGLGQHASLAEVVNKAYKPKDK